MPDDFQSYFRSLNYIRKQSANKTLVEISARSRFQNLTIIFYISFHIFISFLAEIPQLEVGKTNNEIFMTKLILKRKTGYFGIFRALKIWVDGEFLDIVDFRKEKEISVPSGSHQIQVSMDWCKSRPLELNLTENEEIVIHAKSVFLPLAMIFTFLSPSGVFTVKQI